jgi:hypothetical protein
VADDGATHLRGLVHEEIYDVTLVLTAACPGFVVQVADRRLTLSNRPSAAPYDEFANKTVVYRPTDGVVTMGYSGLAYIDGLPTDEWLVQVLTGSEIHRDADDGRPAGVAMGRVANHWDLGRAVREIEGRSARACLRAIPST